MRSGPLLGTWAGAPLAPATARSSAIVIHRQLQRTTRDTMFADVGLGGSVRMGFSWGAFLGGFLGVPWALRSLRTSGWSQAMRPGLLHERSRSVQQLRWGPCPDDRVVFEL